VVLPDFLSCQIIVLEVIDVAQQTEEPNGALILRTLAMPADTNANGDMFGGWIMSQMDIAGGILAKEVSNSRTVTVAAESIQFIRPVQVGDVVCCYGRVLHIGNSSMKINLEVWVKPILRETEERSRRFKVTEAAFTYVAIDSEGNKQPVQR
jgi:acyl-CoA thioesterase YciA